MLKYILSILISVLLTPTISAQNSTDELSLLLATGTLELTSMRGNGSSSGAALEGRIRNTSTNTVRANINLIPPVYFKNQGGSGQDMIGTQIYLDGGSYYTEDDNEFIEINPNSDVTVMIIAYCADFEKDNPSVGDSFSVSGIPQELVEIAWSIASFEAENPDYNTTVPAQVAIWLSQGESVEDIREKFAFNSSDERLAQQLLGQ